MIATGALYAMLAQSVRRRRHEIGIRKALGADAGTVMRMILTEAGGIAVLASMLGALVAMVILERLTDVLAFVDRSPSLALLGTAGALVTVILLAAALPARRAAEVEPTAALRES